MSHRVALGAGGLEGGVGCGVRPGELDRPVEYFGDRGGHVMDPAAAQHQLGEAVVDVRGALDDSAAVPDDLVGAAQTVEGRAGLRQSVRRVDGRRGQRRERAQEGDLLTLEDPCPAVRGEQHSDDVPPDHEGYAEDGHQALVPYARVDGPGVLEPVVLEVVVGDIGAGGLGDEPTEPLPHAEPQLLEARRDRALGDPHIGVSLGLVVQAEVGDVRAQQGPGPLHDRAQDGVEVAQAGQVVGGLEERGQFGLATAPALHLGAHPQGEQLGLFERGDAGGGTALRAGEQDRLFVRLGGGASGQQLEEGRLGVVGAFGGLDVIAGHAQRMTCREAGPTGPVDNPAGSAAPDRLVRRPAAVHDQRRAGDE